MKSIQDQNSKRRIRAAWTLIALGTILFLLSLMYCPAAFSSDLKEADYQLSWCKDKGGIIEYKVHDSVYPSRVDCLTDTHAIEFDYLNKWPQALSQAVYYAKMTNKKPGIVLILKDKHNPYNYVYYTRLLNTVAEQQYKIKFWFVF